MSFCQAIALFNAGHRDEAMQRVQDLTTACQHLDTLPCSIVNVSFMPDLMTSISLKYTCQSYLRAQHGIIAFEEGRYNEAADQLTTSITTMEGSFSHTTLCAPRLKIFTVVRH